MKIILQILLITFSININSQITFTEKKEIKKTFEKPEAYNPLKNFVSKTLVDDIENKKYVGLTAFFSPKGTFRASKVIITTPSIKKNNYLEFHLPKNDSSINLFANKKFEILDIIIGKELMKKLHTIKESYSNNNVNYKINGRNYDEMTYSRFLKIKSKENDSIYYYNSSIALNNLIITDYFENLKNRFLNKKIVSTTKSQPSDNRYHITNIETEKKVYVPQYTFWNVEDITYYKVYNQPRLGLMVTNPDLGKFFYELNTQDENPLKSTLHNKIKMVSYDDYMIKIKKEQQAIKDFEVRLEKRKNEVAQKKKENLRKYGSDFGLLINRNQLEIGMTKEMCLDSWGKPLKVENLKTENKITSNWFYDRNHIVVFTNDKITEIKF